MHANANVFLRALFFFVFVFYSGKSLSTEDRSTVVLNQQVLVVATNDERQATEQTLQHALQRRSYIHIHRRHNNLEDKTLNARTVLYDTDQPR